MALRALWTDYVQQRGEEQERDREVAYAGDRQYNA